ncbi:MAG: indole-3-glycerol phosphate synthase TrpC [Proteobacteria bacterium]|nr:indole-3-glycerol phosphate synthase TrpC [Pseudomonadota bacterium]MBU1710601.1 indole-3-glycerol phosphate synthase TrpC [Pseudomonadota bacterium]
MILDSIVKVKRLEVKDLLNARVPGRDIGKVDPPRGFKQALLAGKGISLIAEAKKASPSKGVICADFDPAEIARQYKLAGAQAMSVLTDENFFQGSLDYIPLVRSVVDLPVLRKDFIIHESQIVQARQYGADAILLIAAILDQYQMRDYLEFARELSLDVLVEVHDEHEAEMALAAGSDFIGINNRNLREFTVDLNTTFQVMREIPATIPVVSESGIRSNEDVRKLAEAGVAAVLVGETLMKSADKAAAVRELMGW